MKGRENTILEVPYMDLPRASQVKVAALLALTKGLINQEDRLVCLSGSPKFDILDSMIILDVGREFEMFTTAGSFLPDHIQRPEGFDRLFTIALELSEEGKEGKPIGTIFVLGDHEKVLELSSQLRPLHKSDRGSAVFFSLTCSAVKAGQIWIPGVRLPGSWCHTSRSGGVGGLSPPPASLPPAKRPS